MTENLEHTLVGFENLINAMRQLRGKDGCAWNRAQTFFTLKSFLMEEAYEVLDSLPETANMPLQSPNALCEELGDLLLQIVFLCALAEENQMFSMQEVTQGILDKIVRRHPHVFDADFRQKVADLGPNEVAKLWEEIKKKEKAKRQTNPSPLQGVPRSMPALLRADTLGKKAHHNGFDWPNIEGVFLKLQEELEEFAQARGAFSTDPSRKNAAALESEMGDVLFTLSQIARFLNLSAEGALHGSCNKFIGRFDEMEKLARQEGTPWESLTLGQKEELWNRVKKISGTVAG